MQFTKDSHDAVADGSITLTVRFWTRAQVKVGGQYNVGPCRIEVDSIELVPFGSLTKSDVRQCGHGSVDELRRLVAHAGAVSDETIVYRIEFHLVGNKTERRVVKPTTAAVYEVSAKLDAMDGRSALGPWTREVLGLIGTNPGMVSTDLAAMVGRDRMQFKADVRKLKALGLTDSLETGYQLTELGRAIAAL